MIGRAIQNAKNLFCVYQTINIDKAKISKFQAKNFSDQVRLTIAAGDGGNGCISYHSDKRIRKGQPDGGQGGKGGNICVEAHKSVFDLSHFRRRNIDGNNGGNGSSNGKDGKNGGQTIIRVPSGTLVYEIQVHEDENTLEKVEKKKFLVDLDEDLAKYVIAKGGQNGKGNKKNPFMREEHKFGKEGQRKILFLQLKSLADIGLVGFPNIGKSTFLASVSRALPKIANYEFTTLKPSIGHVHFVDDFKMTIADIPGIIEGAHMNKGLGLEFLRHVQRTKVLIFVLDITSENPVSQLAKLENELSQYASQKFEKKYKFYLFRHKLVIFNKMDCLVNSENLFRKYSEQIPYKTFLISAKEGENVGEVLVELRRIVEQMRKSEEQEKRKKLQEALI